MTAAALGKDPTNVLCHESQEGLDVFVGHPIDCGLFYQCNECDCALMTCPDQLYFDSTLSACNWPENVQCSRHLVVNIFLQTLHYFLIRSVRIHQRELQASHTRSVGASLQNISRPGDLLQSQLRLVQRPGFQRKWSRRRFWQVWRQNSSDILPQWGVSPLHKWCEWKHELSDKLWYRSLQMVSHRDCSESDERQGTTKTLISTTRYGFAIFIGLLHCQYQWRGGWKCWKHWRQSLQWRPSVCRRHFLSFGKWELQKLELGTYIKCKAWKPV